MLFLVFQLGKDCYALDTTQIVEVLPMVRCKQIPAAPAGVVGVFNYRGEPVPLIDLATLSLGKSSRSRMSTRIILVNYLEESGETHLLGLLAEQATETIRRAETDFVDSGVASDGAPYLGSVTNDARGIIQRVEINQLLNDDLRDLLFRQPLEAA
jgi:chemotaxis-related protein WspB